MTVGGRIKANDQNESAILNITRQLPDSHHVMAVASGELFQEVRKITHRVTGVLTQPLAIRLIKKMQLRQTCDLMKPSLEERILVMRQVFDIYGVLWDPVFMGSVFVYLKRAKTLPARLCIWITCPAGIEWLHHNN